MLSARTGDLLLSTEFEKSISTRAARLVALSYSSLPPDEVGGDLKIMQVHFSTRTSISVITACLLVKVDVIVFFLSLPDSSTSSSSSSVRLDIAQIGYDMQKTLSSELLSLSRSAAFVSETRAVNATAETDLAPTQLDLVDAADISQMHTALHGYFMTAAHTLLGYNADLPLLSRLLDNLRTTIELEAPYSLVCVALYNGSVLYVTGTNDVVVNRIYTGRFFDLLYGNDTKLPTEVFGIRACCWLHVPSSIRFVLGLPRSEVLLDETSEIKLPLAVQKAWMSFQDRVTSILEHHQISEESFSADFNQLQEPLLVACVPAAPREAVSVGSRRPARFHE